MCCPKYANYSKNDIVGIRQENRVQTQRHTDVIENWHLLPLWIILCPVHTPNFMHKVSLLSPKIRKVLPKWRSEARKQEWQNKPQHWNTLFTKVAQKLFHQHVKSWLDVEIVANTTATCVLVTTLTRFPFISRQNGSFMFISFGRLWKTRAVTPGRECFPVASILPQVWEWRQNIFG